MDQGIIKKLNDEINSGITKECQVIYLMIELRKLLEKRKDSIDDFLIVRFYSDWIVHISKDYKMSAIIDIMRKIEKEIPKDLSASLVWQIEAQEHIKFIYMEHLIEEMKMLFLEQGLDVQIFEDSEQKVNFISLLVKVLEDQPINNPIKEIKKFCFEPAAEGCVVWIIEFNDKRGLCRFGNIY